MLILEWSQGCYGRTDGSVTISLRNFVDEWMTDNVRRDAFILSCSHLSMLHSPISLVNPLNYSPGEGLDHQLFSRRGFGPINYSPGEGLDPLTSLTLPHVCACIKPGPRFTMSYVIVFLCSVKVKDDCSFC